MLSHSFPVWINSILFCGVFLFYLIPACLAKRRSMVNCELAAYIQHNPQMKPSKATDIQCSCLRALWHVPVDQAANLGTYGQPVLLPEAHMHFSSDAL